VEEELQGIQQEETPEYWAFISYSHHDKRLARKFVQELSKQVVPPPFRRQIKRQSKRFDSVFLDEHEVAAGAELDEKLKTPLRRSLTLIVICSPFAVGSPYVSAEISYFASLGKAKRILCLIASGVPNASDDGRPELECFPLPLRMRLDANGTSTTTPRPLLERPLAAAVGQESATDWQRALAQIVSGILEISQGELRRHRRRRIIRATSLIVGMLAVLSAAVTSYEYFFNTEQITFYEDYARRWGEWQGINPISADGMRGRGSTLAFVSSSRGRRPAEIRLVNSAGQCPVDGLSSVLGSEITQQCSSRRGCSVKFKYQTDGSIEKEEVLDQFGKPIEGFTYTGPSVATFVEAQFPCSRGASGISYVVFERVNQGEQAGFDQTVRFLGNDKSPRPNSLGAYGYRFDRDSKGRLLSRTNLGPTGEIWWSEGFARIEYERDNNGRVTRAQMKGADGKPFLNKEGYSGWRNKYDERGNRVEFAVIGLDTKPILDKNGVAGVRSKFDERGNEIGTVLFGINGNPTWNKYGVAGWHSKYDERGNKIEDAYGGIDGQSVSGKDGYLGRRNKYDERGNVVEATYIGPDGKPILSKDGSAGWRSKYDERGNLLESTTVGVNGEPIFSKDSSPRAVFTFNEAGRRIQVEFFGLDGKLTLNMMAMRDGVQNMMTVATKSKRRISVSMAKRLS